MASEEPCWLTEWACSLSGGLGLNGQFGTCVSQKDSVKLTPSAVLIKFMRLCY